MALLDKDAFFCSNSQLELFEDIHTQVGIESSRFQKVFPVTSIDSSDALEFTIESGSDHMIDPSSTILILKSKIVHPNGEDIAEPADDAGDPIKRASEVFPICYFGSTRFRQCEVYLNDKLISSSDSLYAYRSYIPTTISYSENTKNEQLGAAMYYRDSNPMQARANPGESHNKGARARFNKTRYSKSFETWTRLHSEIFLQPKFLLPDSKLKIRLVKADPAFCLMSGSDLHQYKILTEKASLLVRCVEVSDSVRLSIAKRLLTTPAKYPVEKLLPKYFIKPRGTTDLSVPSLCTGILPNKVVIGFVQSEALTGSYGLNPFNFEHVNIGSIVLRKDGNARPMPQIDLDFENDIFMEGYMNFVHGTGRLFHNSTCGITPHGMWKDGYTLFIYDLTPDENDGNSVNLVRSGKLSLEVNLRAPTTTNIAVIALFSYSDVILVDNKGQVSYDPGSS